MNNSIYIATDDPKKIFDLYKSKVLSIKCKWIAWLINRSTTESIMRGVVFEKNIF